MNRKMLLLVLLGILLFIVFVQILTNPNMETICILARSSKKERIILENIIVHDFQIYPIMSEQKTGCLLLHDWYDSGSVKYRSKIQFFPFAQFVDDDYDHCCVTGE